MADNVHKYGFRPHRSKHGGQIPEPKEFLVATAYQAQDDGAATNVDLNIGDPVEYVSTGYVQLANTTDAIYGIVAGFKPYWNSSIGALDPTDRLPGGTAWGTQLERASRVLVWPAQGMIWECDFDDAVTATTEAAYIALIHFNFVHLCPADTTDSSKPKADPVMDISTGATTATFEWRFVGLSPTFHNQDYSGNYVKGLFEVNVSSEAGAAATPIAGV